MHAYQVERTQPSGVGVDPAKRRGQNGCDSWSPNRHCSPTQGQTQLTDFRLEEVTIPTPSAGQVLLAVQYLSLDPYVRGRMHDRKSYAKPVQVGDVMVGEAVARVIVSHHADYFEGDVVLGHTGWRTHLLSDGIRLRKLDHAGPPVTTRLGVLGMPGFTAYSGLHVIGKPQPGETVVVAAASGPVGSLVGQLAKMAGAKASGIAGGHEKCALVKNELRFDAAIDHRAGDFPDQLATARPNGIDVYSRMSEGRSGRRCCRYSISLLAGRSLA
jgi:NADPH-dependent curcumin reductase CurA